MVYVAKIKQKSQTAKLFGIFFAFSLQRRIDRIYLIQHLVGFLLRHRRAFLIDITVKIHRHPTIRAFLLLVAAHGMESAIGRQSLQLILQHIPTTVAPDDQRDVAVAHLIEILLAVTTYLAHYFLEEVVGGLAFFRLPFLFASSSSSNSGFTTFGT